MWFVCILKAHGGPRGKPPWSTQGMVESLLESQGPETQIICFLGRKGSGSSLHREAAFYEDAASRGHTLLLITAPLRGDHLTKDSSSAGKKTDTRRTAFGWIITSSSGLLASRLVPSDVFHTQQNKERQIYYRITPHVCPGQMAQWWRQSSWNLFALSTKRFRSPGILFHLPQDLDRQRCSNLELLQVTGI